MLQAKWMVYNKQKNIKYIMVFGVFNELILDINYLCGIILQYTV